jgi:ABC-type sugar transport system ATPase subunit
VDLPNLLEIRQLTVAYRATPALIDLSLAVRAGEIHALLGENGAGKTTLLKLLGGLRPGGSYTGEILFDGRPLVPSTPRDSLSQGIAVLPRRLSVFPALSVVENILIGHMPSTRSFLTNTPAARQQANEVLQRLGVSLPLESRVSQLSDAQKRVVILARALSTHPRLMVLDEPATSVPGAAEMSQLIRILRTLVGQGLAVLYLTHSVLEAMDVADRISVLRDGAVVDTLERIAFEQTRLVLAMMSKHPERVAGPDDDQEGTGGLFGGLRSMFDFRGRRS